GALLFGIRFGVSSYWMNSYWGGALAAAGGAFVLGAMPRLRRHPHWVNAVVMGIGFAILANTRTVEGAVYGATVMIVLAVWVLQRSGPPLALTMRQIVLPLALVLALTLAGLSFYFDRVGGSSWTPPYVAY